MRRRSGPHSVQSVGAAKSVSLAIGHNPGQVATPSQYTSMLALHAESGVGGQGSRRCFLQRPLSAQGQRAKAKSHLTGPIN